MTVHASLDIDLRFSNELSGSEEAGFGCSTRAVDAGSLDASLSEGSESLYASTLFLLEAFFRNVEDMIERGVGSRGFQGKRP